MDARVARLVREHWPEYLMEGAELGAFMVSACLFTALIEHPGSPVRHAIADPTVRRALIGLSMGGTAIAIIYSPWGKQSGAHFNPAVTLTFLRLGLVQPVDALGYAACQFAGAVLGVLVSGLVLGSAIADPTVDYIVTVPGPAGVAAAFAAELLISFGMMGVVLVVTNTPRLARFTGLFAGALVAAYIVAEAPISGMSMNPARTVGSAVWAHDWTALWIYFVAPAIGMLLAADVFVRARRPAKARSAKLHHHNDKRCIFDCGRHDETVAAA